MCLYIYGCLASVHIWMSSIYHTEQKSRCSSISGYKQSILKICQYILHIKTIVGKVKSCYY